MVRDNFEDLIVRAQTLCRSVPERGASEKTKSAYLAAFKRMWNGGDLDPLRPGAALDTYYFRRAALHLGGKLFMEGAIAQCLSAAEKGDAGARSSWAGKLTSLVERLEPLFALDPPQAIDELPLNEAHSRWRQSDNAGRKRGANSKRHALAALPEDWRKRVWNEAPPDWQFLDALALHVITPVRPEELVPGARPSGWSPGVIVEARSPRRMAIIFAPVKSHSGHYGTEQTEICVDPVTFGGAAAHLMQRCEGAGGRLIVSVESKNACRKGLARLGARALPKVETTITPYLFRHQVIADLKATFGAGEQVAMAAGHGTDRTQARYGRVEHGRTRRGYLSINARRPPRCGNVARARQLSRRNASQPAPV